MKLVSRKEARAKGLKRYFTGKPCVNGHTCGRYTSDGICVICKGARQKEWRQENKRYVVRKRHEDYLKTRTQHAVSNKAWRLANPEASLAILRNRKARKRQAQGRHTASDIRKLHKDQRGKCLCGGALGTVYHVDHKTLLSRGGSNWPSNLQLLCGPCNLSKGAKTQEEWLALAS